MKYTQARKIAFVGILAVNLAPAGQPVRQGERKNFVRRTFSPMAAGKSAMGAGVTQATNTPSEWGQGAAGFAKRFGSAFGKHIVKNAIKYPAAKAFHEEFSYHRSDKTGFGPRLKYALTGTIITHKTTTGKRTLSKSELAGAFGSGLISRAWQPASTRTVGMGFASGGITLGVDAAGNVLREFWPEIRHPHATGQARRRKATTAQLSNRNKKAARAHS
ncbi:MAG TPA: hypothetical protein VF146_15460 [Bryobacteraceae bacterium]